MGHWWKSSSLNETKDLAQIACSQSSIVAKFLREIGKNKKENMTQNICKTFSTMSKLPLIVCDSNLSTSPVITGTEIFCDNLNTTFESNDKTLINL